MAEDVNTATKSQPAADSPLSIDNIVDAAFDPKVAVKSALTLLIKTYKQSPVLFAILIGSVLVAGVILRTFGLDVLYFVPPVVGQSSSFSLPIFRDASWVEESYADRNCLARGKSLSRPYVLRNVTQWIRYVDDNDASLRHVNERIIYDVVPLINIKKDDQKFLEEYSSTNKKVHHWFGPQRELFVGGNTKYQVQFEVKHGESTVVVTGAELDYSLPLTDGRSVFRQQATLTHDQDFWVYQNIDDVICNLTQVIESSALQLEPVGRGGRRVGNNSSLEADVYYQATSSEKMTNSSLAISWKDIEPEEDAGIIFKWKKFE